MPTAPSPMQAAGAAAWAGASEFVAKTSADGDVAIDGAKQLPTTVPKAAKAAGVAAKAAGGQVAQSAQAAAKAATDAAARIAVEGPFGRKASVKKPPAWPPPDPEAAPSSPRSFAAAIKAPVGALLKKVGGGSPRVSSNPAERRNSHTPVAGRRAYDPPRRLHTKCNATTC